MTFSRPTGLPSVASSGQDDTPGIPERTVARLPVYLRALNGLAERRISTVSSEALAAAAGVGSAKLRKDLSHLGSYGTRGVGYEVVALVDEISRVLGLTRDWRVAIVGVGNLGRALAAYGGFASRGFAVAALLDAGPHVVGRQVAGLTVRPVSDLEAVIADEQVSIGVIATPAQGAQEICDRFVRAGVGSILSFAPCVLQVGEGVAVRKVDLSTELQILAFHEQSRKVRPGLGALTAAAAPAARLAARPAAPILARTARACVEPS